MTLEEALKLLKETDAAAFEAVDKEIKALENKGTGVEVERKKAEDAKKELDDFKTATEAREKSLKEDIEKAKIEGKNAGDSFKGLYEEEKAKRETLEAGEKGLQDQINSLKEAKENSDKLIAADIEKLYIGLEDDQVATLKNLANKFPIEERVAFIVDFKEKYLGVKKPKWGKPAWGSGSEVTTLEDIQAEYDRLSALPYKTPEDKRALILAAEYLSWKRKLPTT